MKHIAVIPNSMDVTTPCIQKMVSDKLIQPTGPVDVTLGASWDEKHFPIVAGLLLESTPLGRAEYLLPLSSLFGQESLGTAEFASTVSQYKCNQEAFIGVGSGRRKRIVWIKSVKGTPVKMDPDYHDHLLYDAGVHFVADSSSSPSVSTNASALFASVDEIIDETMNVLTLNDFYKLFGVTTPDRIPSVHPTVGRIYKMDRVENSAGAWGNDFIFNVVVLIHVHSSFRMEFQCLGESRDCFSR